MTRKIKVLMTCAAIVLFTSGAALVLGPKDYDPFTLIRSAPIGTGYAAKMLCSGVFVSHRDPQSLWDEDLELMRDNLVSGKVNREDQSAEAYVLGFLWKRKAVYRGPCGCTLLMDDDEDAFRKQCEVDLPAPAGDPAEIDWPLGDRTGPAPAGVDQDQIGRTLDWAFSEPHPDRPMRTRAVIVIYDGKIVAERYAPGFDRNTRLLGWSMSKSVTSALIGILVRQGKLEVEAPAPVPEWSDSADPRAKITLNQLLHMSSGLSFTEEYEDNPDTDAPFMFFTVKDMAAFAAAKPLAAPPDTVFNYSSGTAMILARIVRQTVGGSYADYLAFPRRELFNKLGMRNTLIEPDPSGTMVGAGFTYATARDWARFGLLYYYDGVINGERILPEGWVDYTRAPSPTEPGYGAQFWLNGGDPPWWPHCPPDTYSAWGHEGEFVTIVPSRHAVIVRLGQTFDEEKNWDHDHFVSEILKALPQ